MAYDKNLAERIREVLSNETNVREVKMFGGLTFMVNDKMTATANTHGQLMVRCDPDRADELLRRAGADWPEMRGRKMSKGWIVVDPEQITTDAALESWVADALEFNHQGSAR